MIVLWCWLTAALAAPLQLETVLDAVDTRLPDLAAAQADLLTAEAQLLAARGSFDPVLSAKAGRYFGKYPRTVGRVTATVPTRVGPSVYAGYGYGEGTFPTYDEYETHGAGELFVGAHLPLLDGLGLSKEAAKLDTARAKAAATEAKTSATRLKIRLKAVETYWKWVAAGAKLAVEQTLLEQATTRQAALERQVEEGLKAELSALDNRRALLTRQDAVLVAEQDLYVAALTLSLWYRDPAGDPVLASPDALPELTTEAPALPSADEDLGQLDTHPTLVALDRSLDAAQTTRRRAQWALLPKLDLEAEALFSLDEETKDEHYLGGKLELPTLSRADRGAKAEAEAAILRLEAERRLQRDTLTMQLSALRQQLDRTWQRVLWAREARDLAEEVVRRERRRFELGAGSLFELLGREKNLVAAQKALIAATTDHRMALAAREALLSPTSSGEG